MYGREDSLELMELGLFTNIYSGEGSYMVPTLVGKTGASKTAVMHVLAKKLDATLFVVGAPHLGEKDFSGIPYVIDNMYVQIKHEIIEKISRIEKVYINRLYGDGFLDGKLTANQNVLKYKNNIVYESLLDTEIYSEEDIRKDVFMNIPPEIKLELISKKDIKFAIVFIDELNRAIQPVHQELMTVTQYNIVPGYNIPWFAQFTAAMNPDSRMVDDQKHAYDVRELDNAVLGRFALIPYEVKKGEFVSYLANDKKLDKDMVLAFTTFETNENPLTMNALDKLMIENENNRSMTNAMYTYANTVKMLNNSELISHFRDITLTARNYVNCVAGSKFAHKIISAYENIHKIVTVDDVICDSELSDAVIAKYLASNTFTQITTIELLLNTLCEPEITKDVKNLMVPSNLMKHYVQVERDGIRTTVFDVNCVNAKYLQYVKNVATLINKSNVNVKLSVNNVENLKHNMLLTALLMNLADIAQNRAMLAQVQSL